MSRPTRLKLRDGRVVTLPAVMGILNVTPDSFSDGGQFMDPERALEHALKMQAQGASIIDVGGESTRPYAQSVEAKLELERVGPILQLLGRKLTVPISIDTRKAVVAEAALRLGAAIVNDISALTSDPSMASLVVQARCPVVLMHMRGAPEDHVKFARYNDVVGEVVRYLRARASLALRTGIKASCIILDPGLGFAKTARHNLALLRKLPRLTRLGYPVLIGASRKRFIREAAGEDPDSVASGNDAVTALAIFSGASIIRVHDVAATVAATKMAMAIREMKM